MAVPQNKDELLKAIEVNFEKLMKELSDQKVISFSRQNLSYTERYFAEMFAEHDLARNIAYSCDDSFALISLVSAGLGIGFAPQWTKDFPNRNFEFRKVRGVDFKIGMGLPGTWRIRRPRGTTLSILRDPWSGHRSRECRNSCVPVKLGCGMQLREQSVPISAVPAALC